MNWFILNNDAELVFVGFFEQYDEAIDSARQRDDWGDNEDVYSDYQVEQWIEVYEDTNDLSRYVVEDL